MCLFALNFCYSQNMSSEGNEFWFSFIESGPNNNDLYSIYITSTTDGTATLASPAGNYNLEQNYYANEIAEIILPDSICGPIGTGEITNYGLKLNTTSIVGAYMVNFQAKQSEASIIYPIDLIQTDYVVTTAATANLVRTFIVVATENNTTIEIKTPDDDFEIILNKGQTYQVHSNDDLSGTRIKSMNNKKIAVFSGARSTKMCDSDGSGRNPLFDQLLPVSLLGNEYALIPFKNQGNSLIKILAIQDQTELILGNEIIASLNKYETYILELDKPEILKASKNLQVSQISCHFDSIGDPSLLHLTPINYTTKNLRIQNIQGFGSNEEVFENRYITLISKTANVNTVRFNNNIISDEFTKIESDSSYSFAIMDAFDDYSTIEALNGVYGYASGFGLFDAYTFSLGFTPDTVLSINDPDRFDCNIFPNPTSNYIRLNCVGPKKAEIFNQFGRSIQKYDSIENNLIDMRMFPPGLYHIRIIFKNDSGNNTKIFKVIKN